MISRLSGLLFEKVPPRVIIDINGVGYDLEVPMSTFYGLPEVGEHIALLTHLQIRDDAHLLFGFATEPERLTFRQLLKVSGIGAKSALAILSSLTTDDLAQAVMAHDSAWLTRIPGIGKKTAERLILELKDKLVLPGGGGAAPASQATTGDIVNALLALGYNDKEAHVVVKKLPTDIGVSDGIKMALKFLGAA